MKDELLEKLEKELQNFKDSIKGKGTEYAIDRAYELTVKQEIIDCLQYDISLSNTQIKALLKEENILEGLYSDWLSYDGNMRESIEYCVDKSLDTITSDYLKSQKKNKEHER